MVSLRDGSQINTARILLTFRINTRQTFRVSTIRVENMFIIIIDAQLNNQLREQKTSSDLKLIYSRQQIEMHLEWFLNMQSTSF